MPVSKDIKSVKKVGGKKKPSNLSIKSPNMKKEIKLVCDVCKTNGWVIQKATISRGRIAEISGIYGHLTVRTCTCITCGNMKWFAKKDFIIVKK